MDADVDLFERGQLSESFAQNIEIAGGAAVGARFAEYKVERDVLDVVHEGGVDVHGLRAVAVAGAGDEVVPVHVFVEEVAGFGEDGFVQRQD